MRTCIGQPHAYCALCDQAVQRLEQECKAEASNTLLRCLMDPDADVVAAVLASPSTLLAPPEALYNALTSRLQVAWAQLSSGNRVIRKNAEAIAKKVVLPSFLNFLDSAQPGPTGSNTCWLLHTILSGHTIKNMLHHHPAAAAEFQQRSDALFDCSVLLAMSRICRGKRYHFCGTQLAISV